MTNGTAHPPAAIILAGGEGTRLRALTRRLAGDDRPKQFCPILGDETLLEQTRQRAARLVAPERALVVVTRAHERYYGTALAGAPPETVVVQPANRGTAPAILYALLRLQALAPGSPMVLLPSDHWVADDDAFMARVEGALEAVRHRADLVVLLGVAPDRAETAYGWIEPAEPVAGRWAWPLFGVRRFWEKPPLPVAARLAAAGALWNSFVIAARPATMLRLIGSAVPALADAFRPLAARLGTAWEDETARVVYAGLAATDFSKDVLQRRRAPLAVLAVSGVGWNDLGDPTRALATRHRLQAELTSA